MAGALHDRGLSIVFASIARPIGDEPNGPKYRWVHIERATGILSRLPWFRSSGLFLLNMLRSDKPRWIIAQNEYIVAALIYKILFARKCRVASYITEYQRDRFFMRVLKHISGFIDAYVDICDVRLGWRKSDWPRLRAQTFIIRQAPFARMPVTTSPHVGRAKMVFTGSGFVLGLDRGRLSRFLTRLCESGIAVDWLLPGSDERRSTARSLVSHPRFRVLEPVDKASLILTLSDYDVGLHWAPLAEQDLDRDYFLSAASNKIGEYIAAGLVVAHAGNPGLSYLPDSVATVFDPTDPDFGASQLVAALADRTALEERRAAVIRYHLQEMNFDAQAAPFLALITGTPVAAPPLGRS